jgi:hypothetical protein
MSPLLRSQDDELVTHATEIYSNTFGPSASPIINATNIVKR